MQNMTKISLKPLDDGQRSVNIPFGKTIIGRGPFLGCGDKKVSRNHAVLEVTEIGEVYLTPTHVNPCFYQPTTESPGTILKKDKKHKLGNGDAFSLLPRAFRYQVVIDGAPETIHERCERESEEKTNGSSSDKQDCERNAIIFNETICKPKDALEIVAESKSMELINLSEEKKVDPLIICKGKGINANGTNLTKCSEESKNHSTCDSRLYRTLPLWLEKLTDYSQKQRKKKYEEPAFQDVQKFSEKTKGRELCSSPMVVPRVTKRCNISDEDEVDDFEVEIERPRKMTSRSSRQNRQTRQGLSLEDFIVSDDEEWQSDKFEPKFRKRKGQKKGFDSGSDWEAEHGKKKKSHKFGSDSESGSDWGSSTRRKKVAKVKRRRSKHVAISDGGSDEENEDVKLPSLNNNRRVSCMYGKKCYRKNPSHLSQFSHPGDTDHNSETELNQKINERSSSASGDEEFTERKECQYGLNCYRKAPQHKRDFKHTRKLRPQREAAKQAGKKNNHEGNNYDEPDSYDIDDHFVNDDSDEYQPVESASDWESSEDIKKLAKDGKQLIKARKL